MGESGESKPSPPSAASPCRRLGKVVTFFHSGRGIEQLIAAIAAIATPLALEWQENCMWPERPYLGVVVVIASTLLTLRTRQHYCRSSDLLLVVAAGIASALLVPKTLPLGSPKWTHRAKSQNVLASNLHGNKPWRQVAVDIGHHLRTETSDRNGLDHITPIKNFQVNDNAY